MSLFISSCLIFIVWPSSNVFRVLSIALAGHWISAFFEKISSGFMPSICTVLPSNNFMCCELVTRSTFTFSHFGFLGTAVVCVGIRIVIARRMVRIVFMIATLREERSYG